MPVDLICYSKAHREFFFTLEKCILTIRGFLFKLVEVVTNHACDLINHLSVVLEKMSCS